MLKKANRWGREVSNMVELRRYMYFPPADAVNHQVYYVNISAQAKYEKPETVRGKTGKCKSKNAVTYV